MKLAKYLANLGYGSRREVEWLIDRGRVRHDDGTRLGLVADVSHDLVRVDGEPLDPALGVVIALDKPEGYVCSTKDVPPTIYELLPERFRFRTPLLSPVGRLDRDTSGLLLLTDDGALNHRLTSPRSHVAKVYDVTASEAIGADVSAKFLSGTLMLDGETTPLAPALFEQLDDCRARVTLTEGRYHQIRRMFVAVGSHVVALRRVAIGGLGLAGLQSGEWRTLQPLEIVALFDATSASRSTL